MKGWRLFFYANEGFKPVHVHARKGDAECKFWLDADSFEIEEDWSYHLSLQLRREIRKIIFEHFDIIVAEWNNFFEKGRRAEN